MLNQHLTDMNCHNDWASVNNIVVHKVLAWVACYLQYKQNVHGVYFSGKHM